MCSHYHAPQDRKRFATCFGIEPPQDMGKHDVWPGYAATFIRKVSQNQPNSDTLIQRETLTGLFGLVPHWATDLLMGRKIYSAVRSLRRSVHCWIEFAAQSIKFLPDCVAHPTPALAYWQSQS